MQLLNSIQWRSPNANSVGENEFKLALNEYGRRSFVEIVNEISCSIPDDHIDPRRTALFMARSILREVRDGGRTC